ncbi:MAG: 3,4-dehydroadipyl-CoA semialdehyde dehydrogenase [Planctomycetota bacterium]
MRTLKSHVSGKWHEASTDLVPLFDPCSEEQIAQASSTGVDFAAALEYARSQGGPALRELSFIQRGELLMGMSKALHAHREELIQLSLKNTGATRKDAKFDLDGATGTLSYYAYLAKEIGDLKLLRDGDGEALGRSAKFWGQHVRVPLHGAALHVNAFNFPAWGFSEKAACAFLAGMPVITKPATSTALVTERCVEIIVEAGLLPPGVLSLICGRTGDLISRLGSQDVLAFTGSAATALKLRRRENLLASSVRVNIEADSLNAAVLGPDVESGSETWGLFIRDVVREITQKAGQKCTAVRRILVPEPHAEAVQEALVDSLERVVTGNPADSTVTMGPLATAHQLEDAIQGVAELRQDAQLIYGTGERVSGAGNPPGKGYFFAPTLLCAGDSSRSDSVHSREVFGPVATILPYDASASEAARLVALGGGCLVTSLYSDQRDWVGEWIAAGASWSGRLYLGSLKMAEQALGSGIALPNSFHGGPGRAGGGGELGGLRGLHLYTQAIALQGSRSMIERL